MKQFICSEATLHSCMRSDELDAGSGTREEETVDDRKVSFQTDVWDILGANVKSIVFSASW